jgi:hypothetical protein
MHSVGLGCQRQIDPVIHHEAGVPGTTEGADLQELREQGPIGESMLPDLEEPHSSLQIPDGQFQVIQTIGVF